MAGLVRLHWGQTAVQTDPPLYHTAVQVAWTILYYDGLVPCRSRRTGVCTVLRLYYWLPCTIIELFRRRRRHRGFLWQGLTLRAWRISMLHSIQLSFAFPWGFALASRLRYATSPSVSIGFSDICCDSELWRLATEVYWSLKSQSRNRCFCFGMRPIESFLVW